jgi:methionine synthase II (cobalamin-independent)
VTRATGIGSLPGTDAGAALRLVRELFGDGDLPHLVELPARGPGADLIGRSAGLLLDLHVDLQPAGWRFVDRPGRDASRTASLWRRDLDELAEAFDGYEGELKVQVAGPWTLAAAVELNRGERALVDEGASRDIADSLAAGVAGHVADVERLVPGATVVVQVDEPSLPAVLGGSLPTQSGYGRLRSVDPQRAADGIRTVLAAVGERRTIVHCCAAAPPIPLLRNAGATAISIDTTLLSPAGWESVAATVESGTDLVAGCLPTDGSRSREEAVRALLEPWERTGLEAARLDDLVVSPACGLAGASPADASVSYRVTRDIARELTDRARP